jgi:nucleotide-binding universal stress UspA family protein
LFSKILVAVDGSEPSDKAFIAALELVESCLNTAEIMLVHVIPTPILQDKDNSSVKTIYEEEGSLLHDKYEKLAKVKYGRQVKKKILVVGDEGDKILEAAYKNNVDLIVVGHRGFGKWNSLWVA